MHQYIKTPPPHTHTTKHSFLGLNKQRTREEGYHKLMTKRLQTDRVEVAEVISFTLDISILFESLQNPLFWKENAATFFGWNAFCGARVPA
jgi:hypothetical protein